MNDLLETIDTLRDGLSTPREQRGEGGGGGGGGNQTNLAFICYFRKNVIYDLTIDTLRINLSMVLTHDEVINLGLSDRRNAYIP